MCRENGGCVAIKYARLGDLLVKSGAITENQLKQALDLQKKSGDRLGIVLQKEGIVTERQVIDALIAQLGVEFIDLNACGITSDMAQLVPKNIATKYTVVPIKATRSEIWLAMTDPLNFIAQEEVQAVSKRRVIPLVATTEAAERAITKLYSNQGAVQAIEEMQREVSGIPYGVSPTLTNDSLNISTSDTSESAAPAIRLVNSIIDRACMEGASDIHLDPTDGDMLIRMRIDGALRTVITVPQALQGAVISRLKIMSKLDIAVKMLPQDGRAIITVKNETLDLRVSTLPTIHGEKMVIRLLRKVAGLSTLEGIGLKGDNLAIVNSTIVKNKEGVILVVGPTGSGKTSTLYAMIDKMKSDELNLISLEDPVEYHLSGICQVQINDKTGLTFANALRSVLRQDPDIIAVGEIRDGETAEIAMRAAMTGHLVLSTIHTNNAVSSIDRLLDIGVESYLIASAVKCIISQRLVRRICPHCRRAYKASLEEQKAFGLSPADYTFYKGIGCNECFNTGYRGRIGVFEVLTITPDIRRAIHSNSIKELEAAVGSSGFHPILDNCLQLVLGGVSSFDEIYRVVGGLKS